MALTWAHRCVLWASMSACLTAYIINAWFMRETTWLCRAVAGVFVTCGGLSTMIAFHISTLRCSETHTLMTLLVEYTYYQSIALFGPLTVSKLTKAWKEPRKAQETFLMELISRDANTEYGKRYLRGIQSLQDFRDKHPLTKYDHYQDYFQRLADGEKNVCVATKVERFGLSSGTTGKGKLIPLVISKSGAVAGFVYFRRLAKFSPVQKMVTVYCKPAHKFTKSGLLIAPTSFIQESRASKFMTGSVLNTPFPAFQISTDFEASYVHLLFALADKNIFMFTAPFASQVYRAFAVLEDKKDMLLADLSQGKINPSLNLDEDIRRSLNAALKPNPARADELRAEFARGFVSIASRIWPHLECILTIDVSEYMKKLEEKYAKGTKLFTSSYTCTECLSLGINLWMDGRTQQYVLLPGEVMLEFIPEEFSVEDDPETLLIDEVEVGKRYEIVLTTISGFYRYRMGDVVEVVGFYEKCPVIQVKYRTGELLNLRSEKIDKHVVNNAIQESLGNWPGVTLVEWTCAESPLLYEDQDGVAFDMFYLLFIEFESVKTLRLSEEQKSLFDKSLRKQHEFYDNYRQVGTISEARVMIVFPGSFKKFQDFIIANSTASYNQFKMPKKLRSKATVDFLVKLVVDM
ncbi:GH3 domain-containing protein-like [Acanthaster planci]|uniref:GH3 domain-containing protein-like n=1 Tax=Acanthaster planci TaxID=133434 RepID=A0A8B7ZNS6_ACAPL|nr:GH3 domain-containing protein-like [Acanthaster planci]